MPDRFASVLRLALLSLLVASSPTVAPPVYPRPARGDVAQRAIERLQARRLDEAAARRDVSSGPISARSAGQARRLLLEPGDLASATEKKFSAIHVQMSAETPHAKLLRLDEPFIPRNVDTTDDATLIAVAAVSRVLLIDTETSTVTVLATPDPQRERFGFASDVLFDGDGKLLIADQGEVTEGPEPADGIIWQYELESGEFTRIAYKRDLSNPRLLAQDASGKIYVVDGEAGPVITPAFDFRYDLIYKVVGGKRQGARKFYTGTGVQATAFDIGPDGLLWVANVTEIATIRAKNLSLPCALPAPFQFVTGLTVAGVDQAYVLDGAAVKPGKRTLYEVDAACTSTKKLEGKKLAEARGLALVGEGSS